MSNSVVVASAGQGVMVTNDQTGRTNLVPGVVLVDPATGLPYAGGTGGGGSSGGLTNAELRAAAVPVSLSSAPLPTGAATAAAQATANAALGAPADARAAWYDSAASLVSVIKLAVAAFVGAGGRSYVYTNGVLTSEAWTLFGTTRTKTYTYTSGQLTGESDWV